MFGYIAVNQPELKIREYETYRAWYCGLCHSLKNRYGRVGQMTLTYDLTFLLILLSGLYEPETRKECCRCGVHPIRPHPYQENEISGYVADMNILMAYYQSLDDWKDEKKIRKGLLSRRLAAPAGRICERYPEKTRRIKGAMEALNAGEKSDSTDIDEMAGHFGQVMGELFCYREDEWREVLYRMGFFLGKYIYLMDAYEDLEEDRKKGNYNPLLIRQKEPDFDEWCRQVLTMMMSECARAFEVLPIVQDVEILRNILYAGVWGPFERVRERRNNQGEKS